MKLTPNLDRRTRVAYVISGLALMAAAWLGPFTSRTLALTVGLLGFISIGEGLVGF